MSRTEALRKLLEHGPLRTDEIMQIMGGNTHTARRAVERCVKDGHIQRLPAESGALDGARFKRPVYALRG